MGVEAVLKPFASLTIDVEQMRRSNLLVEWTLNEDMEMTTGSNGAGPKPKKTKSPEILGVGSHSYLFLVPELHLQTLSEVIRDIKHILSYPSALFFRKRLDDHCNTRGISTNSKQFANFEQSSET